MWWWGLGLLLLGVVEVGGDGGEAACPGAGLGVVEGGEVFYGGLIVVGGQGGWGWVGVRVGTADGLLWISW